MLFKVITVEWDRFFVNAFAVECNGCMPFIEYVNVCYESAKNHEPLGKDICIIKISGESVLSEVKRDLHKVFRAESHECQLTLKFMLLVTLSTDLSEIERSFVDFVTGLFSTNAADVEETILNMEQVLSACDLSDVMEDLNHEPTFEFCRENDNEIGNRYGNSVSSRAFRNFFARYCKCKEAFSEDSDRESRACGENIALKILHKYIP